MANMLYLEKRAQSYGTKGDPTFKRDVQDYLQEIEGDGWTKDTSEELDYRSDDDIREAGWWLVEQGTTVCGFDLPVVSAENTGGTSLIRAIGNRTELSTAAWTLNDSQNTELPATVRDERIDVVAVDEETKQIVLLQTLHRASNRKPLQIADFPVATLIPLLHSSRLGPPAEYDIVTAFRVSPTSDDESNESNSDSNSIVVEPDVSDDIDWSELVESPKQFVQIQDDVSPLRNPSESSRDAALVGSRKDVLGSIPPCRGAIVGATVIELLTVQQRSTRLGAIDLAKLKERLSVTLAISESTLEELLLEVVNESRLISRFKLGDTVYPYLSPNGTLRAATLLRRIGEPVSADETVKLMNGHTENIRAAVRRIKLKSRKGDLEPGAADLE